MAISDTFFPMGNAESCLPCTSDEQRRVIARLTQDAESNLKEGNVYYILSVRWWREWQKYAGHNEKDDSIDEKITSHQLNGDLSKVPYTPGPIDNSDLVMNETNGEDEELELREHLQEEIDYVLVAQEVWKKLLEWHKGGPSLPRKMISQGSLHKSYSVEVYPLRLHLLDSGHNVKSIIRISKMSSVRELYDRICVLFKLDQEKVRLWDYFNKTNHAVLNNLDQTLEEASLHMDQNILLEVEKDGLWTQGIGMDSTGNNLALVVVEPSQSLLSIEDGPTISNGHNTTGYDPGLMQGSIRRSTLRASEDGNDLLSSSITKGNGGLIGLQNLGNTCFMNSALQCLVHTPPLIEYFLQDYSEEINRDNPLGLKGELAIAFGELLRKLWSSGKTSVAPRAFKVKLARFAPQFSGYNQHDSQELLAFLLDGLHEDLNRVKHKPYIDLKDANGRSDEEFADECWATHKARNNSTIVDICQGQYKSTLVCPVCCKISVTFDPFMYLSLPLPSTSTLTMTITVFNGDGSALPRPYTVSVLKNGSCKDLTQALSSACSLKSDESLLIVEVYDHRIYRYLDEPFESLSYIKDDDRLVAYRLPAKCKKLSQVEILHQRKARSSTELRTSLIHQELVGTPLVTCLQEAPLTASDIQAAVCAVLAPFRKRTLVTQHNLVKVSKNGRGSQDSQGGVDADIMMDNGDACSSPNNDRYLFNSSMELEPRGDGDPSFQLWVTDEKGFSRTPIEDYSFIRSGPVIKVLVDWSEREHDLYDFSCLEEPEMHKSGILSKKTRQEAISLFSCLESFLKEEPLGPDDMWYCPTCKEHRQATKKLDLWRLPDILVFHLKRFSYSRYLKNKLDTLVDFPIHNLDLSKYVIHKAADPQSHMYQLYAVSNHYGGLGGGHYTAYAKLLEDNGWYHFDDSHVSPASENLVKTSAAYVLFYQRIDSMMELGEPSLADCPSC